MHYYPRIKDTREDRDYKQKEIAAIVGTTQRQYSRWETGTTEIPTHIVIELSRLYKVSTDYLLGQPEGLPYGNSKTKRRK